MEFYKKNPEIKDEVIFVCGERIASDTVVSGEKFRPFADPKTFPGIPASLVKVEFNQINDDQRQHAVSVAEKEANEPPRHIGPTTSANFKMTSDGDFEIKSNPVVEQEKKEKEEVKAQAESGKKEILLDDVYGAEKMAILFPGVTEDNADRVIGKFKSLANLSRASNIDLRACGINPALYKKLREKACLLLDELMEG